VDFEVFVSYTEGMVAGRVSGLKEAIDAGFLLIHMELMIH